MRHSGKELFLLEKGKWNDISAFQRRLSSSRNLKIGHEMVRRYDQDERETGGVFVGILWAQNCGKHFRSPEGENSRTRIGFNTLMKEAAR